jgi:DNA end-binding protein Ku
MERMAARSSGTGTISFGLVTIPVKMYGATTSHGIGFHLMHKKCGTRLKMQYVCPFDGEVVDRTDSTRGFEYAKEQYVEITDEELETLRPETTDRIDLLEFVPAETVDFLYIERTSYLGPDKGGSRAYKLLANAMERMKRIGVGRYGARGKDQLVLLRPYRGGLVMHQVHYADEVRSFEEVAPAVKMDFRAEEEDLADQLIRQLSTDAFHSEKYHDEYQERLVEAIERKVAGQEIRVAPQQPQAPVIDLFDALRQSLKMEPKPAAEQEMPIAALPLPAVGETSPGLKKASRRVVKERERKAG